MRKSVRASCVDTPRPYWFLHYKLILLPYRFCLRVSFLLSQWPKRVFFLCLDYFSLDLVLTLIALLIIGFPATFFVTTTGTGARLAQSKNTSVKIDRPAHGSPQGERFSNHLGMIRSPTQTMQTHDRGKWKKEFDIETKISMPSLPPAHFKNADALDGMLKIIFIIIRYRTRPMIQNRLIHVVSLQRQCRNQPRFSFWPTYFDHKMKLCAWLDGNITVTGLSHQ